MVYYIQIKERGCTLCSALSSLTTLTAACTAIMTHTLVLHEESVVFEHHRGEEAYEENKEGYAKVREILKAKKEIRVLTERETLAIKRVHYRA